MKSITIWYFPIQSFNLFWCDMEVCKWSQWIFEDPNLIFIFICICFMWNSATRTESQNSIPLGVKKQKSNRISKCEVVDVHALWPFLPLNTILTGRRHQGEEIKVVNQKCTERVFRNYTIGQRNVVRNKMWWVQSPIPIPFMPVFTRWTESFSQVEQ